MSKEEFDAAVKASGGFIAQRTYSASSQEVLDAYQDSLYNGEWQLGGKGGTHYGQGMYCAFSGRGEITDYVKGEMAHYQELYGLRHPEVKEAARNQYIDRAISDAGSELERVSLKEKILGNTTDKEYDLYSTRTREQEVAFRKKAARIMEEADRKAEEGFSIVETMTLHPSANVAEIQELKRVKKEDAPTFQDMDIGVYAALRGYDAIKVGGDDESVAYAVILNRTKVIFADGSAHHDSKDESVIVFHFGNDGVLYAFRNKEVIGWVDASEDDSARNHDGSSSSGNWGHEGRPGEVGGSAGGGASATPAGISLSGAFTPTVNLVGWEDADIASRESLSKVVRSNIKELKAAGIKDYAKTADEVRKQKLRAASAAIRETSTEDAIRAITSDDGIPDNVRRGWFVEANSEYKPKIESVILNNPEVRNAGLNVAYRNFLNEKGATEANASFDDFLKTPIQLYRGTHGQTTVAGDNSFTSFTPNRKIAEGFGGNVETISIRPIDTYGSFQTTGEQEILVPALSLAVARSKADSASGLGADIEKEGNVEQSVNGKNNDNSPKPLDKTPHSGTIKLENTNTDGGPGSGNHGHKGVKGQRGGSAPSGNSETTMGPVSATGENVPCVGFASKSKLKSHTRRHGLALGVTSEAEYQQKGIDFLKQPCGGDVIGYAASDGKVVRFNTRTTEYATGYPGDRLCTYMKPKAKKDGTANPEAAMIYYNQRKGESE